MIAIDFVDINNHYMLEIPSAIQRKRYPTYTIVQIVSQVANIISSIVNISIAKSSVNVLRHVRWRYLSTTSLKSKSRQVSLYTISNNFSTLDCTKLQKRLGVLETLFTPVEISFPVFDSWAVQMVWRKYINGSFILETRHSHKFDRSKSTINRGLSNEVREKALINSARE